MKTRCAALCALLLLFLPALPAQEEAPGEFVTMFNDSVPELDPHRSIFSNEAQIFTAVCEGLFSYDPATLEPVKACAASWTKSADGKAYTFSIRKNAQWSDGSRVTAADFKESWLRILGLNAEYASFFDLISGAKSYRLKLDADPSHVGIEAKDPGTLSVMLERPAAYFTRLLCHHSFAPIHQSMRTEKDFASRIPFPVNGPYRFARYSGKTLELEKNACYWDEKSVAIPRLKMLFSDDDAAASRMFNSEEAHWLAGPGDYDAILEGSAIQTNPIFGTGYWYFNCSAAPWNNARVRRALALLLPWGSLRSEENYIIPATTLVLPLPGYSKAKGIEKGDRTEALKLLSEAGFPEGAGLPEIKIYHVDGKDARRVAGIFKSSWETLPGIKVSLFPVSAQSYYGTVNRNKGPSGFTLAHVTWIGDFADPEAFLQMWTPDSPLNDAQYKDPEFSSLLEKSYARDGAERMDLLAEAETVLLQGAAVLPMYHGFAVSVIDTGYIRGWSQNALDIHPYKYLSFGERQIRPDVARHEGSLLRLASMHHDGKDLNELTR